MHLSVIERRGAVPFPAFTGERVYMEPIHNGVLPEHLARWTDTVQAMLTGMPTPPLVFLMVDQQRLVAGQFHRRPGVHVDGYWVTTAHHGAPGPRHRPEPDQQEPTEPRHRPAPARHRGDNALWYESTFAHPEALLLASNVVACRAFVGLCQAGVGDGGDCAHVDLSDMEIVQLDAGLCYAGTVGTLHESIPVAQDCMRTLVRLNVPGA